MKINQGKERNPKGEYTIFKRYDIIAIIKVQKDT